MNKQLFFSLLMLCSFSVGAQKIPQKTPKCTTRDIAFFVEAQNRLASKNTAIFRDGRRKTYADANEIKTVLNSRNESALILSKCNNFKIWKIYPEEIKKHLLSDPDLRGLSGNHLKTQAEINSLLALFNLPSEKWSTLPLSLMGGVNKTVYPIKSLTTDNHPMMFFGLLPPVETTNLLNAGDPQNKIEFSILPNFLGGNALESGLYSNALTVNFTLQFNFPNGALTKMDIKFDDGETFEFNYPEYRKFFSKKFKHYGVHRYTLKATTEDLKTSIRQSQLNLSPVSLISGELPGFHQFSNHTYFDYSKSIRHSPWTSHHSILFENKDSLERIEPQYKKEDVDFSPKLGRDIFWYHQFAPSDSGVISIRSLIRNGFGSVGSSNDYAVNFKNAAPSNHLLPAFFVRKGVQKGQLELENNVVLKNARIIEQDWKILSELPWHYGIMNKIYLAYKKTFSDVNRVRFYLPEGAHKIQHTFIENHQIKGQFTQTLWVD